MPTGDGARPLGHVGVLVVAIALATTAVSAPLVGAAAVSADDGTPERSSATDTPGSLFINTTLSLTPERPGEVRAVTTFGIPDGMRQLTVRLPEGATVRSVDGFVRRTEREYEWDGTTEGPSITFDHRPNETVSGGEGSDRSGYLYVDAGDWALVERPGIEVQFAGTGAQPGIERRLAADRGVAGTDLAYLGPYDHHARRAAGQRLRLVVPARAEMVASPSAVLDSVADAARRLDVGDRDATVLLVAAPTTVDWGSTGLQVGDRDAWVRDVQPLDTPQNVWIHEYVHTRQSHRTTTATRWTGEGFAEYYAVLLTLQQDRIDFETFRAHLERGGDAPYGDAVLAEPDTWSGRADYWKGALVAGAVDYRLRRAGGDLDAVFARLNTDPDGRVNASEFLAAVRAAGGDEVAAFAREHVETGAVPATWNRRAHVRQYGGLALLEAEVRSYRVTGPYRTVTTDAPPTLVPGETLTALVGVTNAGDAAGDFSVVLTVDTERVEGASGRLAAGESTTIDLSWTPSATGGRTVSVAGSEAVVAVRDPATPTVANLSVDPSTVAPREAVTVTATVENPAGRPAAGRVVVRADGAPLLARQVRLAPGAATTLNATARFDAAGAHTLRAGDRTAAVRVSASATPVAVTPTGGGDAGSGPSPTAGTGPLWPGVALVGIAVATALRRWRAQR